MSGWTVANKNFVSYGDAALHCKKCDFDESLIVRNYSEEEIFKMNETYKNNIKKENEIKDKVFELLKDNGAKMTSERIIKKNKRFQTIESIYFMLIENNINANIEKGLITLTDTACSYITTSYSKNTIEFVYYK